jgi:hypothetical protein
MRKISGVALFLLLLVPATQAFGHDRPRDRRDFRRNVEIQVVTPYGGGYFVKGYRDRSRYDYDDRDRYRGKHRRKHHKKYKRFRGGHVHYYDDHGRCRYRH